MTDMPRFNATVTKEYGELPNADHALGYLWRVELFEHEDRVDTLYFRDEAKALDEVALWTCDSANENYDYDGPDYSSDYDESMDGDHDSAMASAGFGTDEDYGCFGTQDEY